MKSNFTRQQLSASVIAGLVVLLSALSPTTFLHAQSASYGNTYIPNGAETVVFGAHSFQNGGSGVLPGIVFTERTSPQGYLSFANGSSATDAADNAHVNGYVRKYGATAFTFPIGNGTVYRPLITPAQSASTVLGAAYFLTNPSSATLPAGAPFPTTNLGTGVSGVSPVEYWDLDGALATTITLTWNAASNLTTLTNGTASRLIVVGYNPSTSKWENLGQASLTGTLSTTGTITSSASFIPNTYSVLTFGTMAMIIANSDAGTASSGAGGTAVADVRTNDQVNGVAATSTNSTLNLVSSTSPGVTLNTATGAVSVAIGTAPGNYTLTYQLCDKLTPPNCTTGFATVTVLSSAVSTPDAGTALASGGTAVTDVRANDVVNGVPATSANSSLSLVSSTSSGITLNPTTGSVSVATGTAPGNYTLTYSICSTGASTTCSTSYASVTVLASAVASPDAGTALASGGTPIPNVRANDVVNGVPATAANSSLSLVSSTSPGVTLNTTTGSVSVTAGTTPGSYTLTYSLCTTGVSGTCTTSFASVTIMPSVIANPDAGTGSSGTGGTAITDVRANDVVNGQPAISANSSLSLVSSQDPGISLNTTTGSVSVAVGTAPGSYTLTYSLCSTLGTTTCTTGLATITVTPSVTAAPDAGTALASGSTAIPNVRANDIVNGVAATSANSSLNLVSTSPGVTLNTSTGAVNVAVGTAPGTYTLTYSLCSTGASTTCATTFASVTVIASATVNPDAGAAPASGGTAIADVRANDIINGVPATSANSSLSLVSSTSPGVTLNTTTGSVSVATGTAPGNYTLTYSICSTGASTTCATSYASVTVLASVTASPDAGTAPASGGTAIADVRANDIINGVPATSANSSLSLVSSTSPGITLNPTTGSVSVATGTAPGNYTLTYSLCSTGASTTCATTFASVTVLTSVTASPDAGTALASGGTPIADVRANDVVNGVAATSANSSLNLVSSTSPGVTLNTSTGAVNVAVGTAPGTYTLTYSLCSTGASTTCATTFASVTVIASATVNPDAGAAPASGGTAVTDVRANDVVNGVPATSANSSLSLVSSTSPGITLNPTTGSVSVATGTAPGNYTLTYSICSTGASTTCATTFASVTVLASVTASPDAGTVSAGTGGVAVTNVRANDVVNGQPASAANSALSVVGTYPAGITLNTSTGSVSVVQGTAPGIYTFVYQLCDLLTPATCTTATATITITPSVTASPDAGTALAAGGTAINNVTTNDIINGVTPVLSGAATNATLTILSTTAGITLNTSTGSVNVAAGTPPGTYTLVYQLCTTASPVVCATATATVTVIGPDLTVSIGQPAPALLVGQTSNLPVVVSNIGAAPTSGLVSFTLSVPASVTVPATFTSNGFGCVTSGTLVSCSSSAVITNGASTTVQVPITPSAVSSGTSPTLSATVATANESNVNNNTTSTTVGPVTAPDLTILIGQALPALVVGQTSIVPITVSNIGTAPTSGLVSFTLSVPASVTVPATFTSNGFGCVTSGTLVSCSSSAVITNGASTTVQVPVTPLPVAVGTSPMLSGTVAVANEGNPNNNTATTTVTPAVVAPDLTISIGQPSPVLTVGLTSTVPVIVSNIGTAPTSGLVSFTLNIPNSTTAPATFTSNGFGCTTSGTRVTCSSSATISDGDNIMVSVPVTATTVALNPVFSATVATANESNPNNNTATITASSVLAPDLTISISQPSSPLVAGMMSTLPITINNIGSSPTLGPVSFTLTIPTTLNAPPSFTSTGFTCTTSGTRVSCNSSATIANGASVSLDIPVTPQNAAVGTSPVLSATVATVAESNVNNNTAVTTVITPVAGQPDLIVAVGQPSPNLTVGQVSSIPVSLSNIGTAPTSGPVSFTLSIPTNVSASATFTSNGFGCTTSGTLVSCSSPTAISNGASTTVLVPITPLPASTGTTPVLGATVATGNESNPNNNTTTTTVTTPVTAPDLIIALGQPNPALVVGQMSSLPVSLSNVGSAPTSGPVSFTLSLPANMTALAAFTSNGFGCTTSGTLVSCTSSATITNGTSTTVLVPITPLTALAGTSPVLSATVATPNESNIANNTASTAVTVSTSVVAGPDPATVSAVTGGIAVVDVRANDLVNSQPATSANSTLTLVSSSNPGITLNPATGSVSVAQGTVPGNYTLVYQLCDKLATPTCTTGLVSVTVVGSPPLAIPDIANTLINTPVSGNLLTNDSDPQGLPLTASLSTPPANGTVVVNPNGSYTYTPPTNFTGTVSFCYAVSNTAAISSTACISINVVPGPVVGNNTPIANNDNGLTIQNKPVIIAVLANDSDPDSATSLNGQLANPTLLAQPTSGTVVVNANGTVTYTPPTNFTGLVSFPYQVCDKANPALCTMAIVSVLVQPTPPAGTTLTPVAVDDALLTRRNTTMMGNVSTNDYDLNDPAQSLNYSTGQPTNGTVVMSFTGGYTYTPTVGYTGPDSFTYVVCNTGGKCSKATVSVLVQPQPTLVALSPQVYLQGALYGVSLPNRLMRDDLRAGGYLPLTHPYATWMPITPTNPMTPSVTAVTGTNAIVDWVFVELRSVANGSIVVDSRAALVQRDGDIVDSDGVSPVIFSQAPIGSYYVAVRHRNHLGVMSQAALPLSATATTIDFRNPNTPTFTFTGTTSYTQVTADQPQVVVDQGVALWAGNALNDNNPSSPHNLVIYQGSNNDVNQIYQQVVNAPGNGLPSPFYKLKGYYTGDVNLDGQAIFQGTGNDVEFIYQNVIKNHPGNSLHVSFFTIREQIP